MITTSMTADEEPRFAAAFCCTSCDKRYLELWPERGAGRLAVESRRVAAHRPVEEK